MSGMLIIYVSVLQLFYEWCAAKNGNILTSEVTRVLVTAILNTAAKLAVHENSHLFKK